MNLRFIGLAIMALSVILTVWFYFAVWQEMPESYTRMISLDDLGISAVSLADAEILPVEKVRPGTFRVEKNFNEILGGIVAYGVSYENQSYVLKIEKWKGRGDAVFDYAVVRSQPFSLMSERFYTSRQVIWTGDDFQIVFVKDVGWVASIVLVSFIVFMVSTLIILAFLTEVRTIT